MSSAATQSAPKTLTAGTVLRFAGDTANDPKTLTVARIEDGWFWYVDTEGRERCAPVGLAGQPNCSVVS